MYPREALLKKDTAKTIEKPPGQEEGVGDGGGVTEKMQGHGKCHIFSRRI